MTAIQLDRQGLIDGIPVVESVPHWRNIRRIRRELGALVRRKRYSQTKSRQRNKLWFTCDQKPGVFCISDIARMTGKSRENIGTRFRRAESLGEEMPALSGFTFHRVLGDEQRTA